MPVLYKYLFVPNRHKIALCESFSSQGYVNGQ